ncbi:low affinity immunoglobulin gamma Fc region receptor II-a [Fundulus heteroclitus]|uniref:low affinity immunoglobulin gamma Fc region receptor II-a n=1 Tax=Fundulus heteroclitus TaxID=8078 RepID=UPI00165B1A44|nr:low affinity immunoglobulin gamma Fc region receptor II-a [Fundulus heteroclitus]
MLMTPTPKAVLRILPNRSQFFRYNSVTLSCADDKNSSDWRVKRNTNNSRSEECPSTWGKRNGSHCSIDDVYPFDSGQYWCESATGACSEVINVTVTDGPVILESPVLPVTEGDAVILRCILNEASSSSNLTQFYKDGRLIGSSSAGIITILDVSKSDEGLYKCDVTGAGGSPESWLSVRGSKPESFRSHPTYVLLPVVAACLSFASVMLLYLWRNLKAKADHDVPYTDVTFQQRVLPKTNSEMASEPALYSTIKHGAF